MLNNNSSILNMTAQALSRDRRGTRDHIGHLISVRAVSALGTSLFVVSAYLHAHGGGALQRPGKILSSQHICNSRSFQYCKLQVGRINFYLRLNINITTINPLKMRLRAA